MKSWYSLLFACILNSGILIAQQTRSLSSFDEVNVATGIKGILVNSNESKVVLELENCSPEEVITEVRGTKLMVKFTDHKGGWSKHHNRKATVTIHYQELSSIAVSSGGSINSTSSVVSNQLEIDASSGGRLDLEVEARELDIDVSSGGNMHLSGHADDLTVDVSSGGMLNGYELKSKNVNADASSGGMAKITVSASIDADASSGGSIQYKGNPSKQRINSSISGSIKSRS